MSRPRIAFLFNHDALHQIAHSVGILGELARGSQPITVIAAYGGARTRQHIERLLPPGAAERIMWHDLGIPSLADRVARVLNHVAPVRRLARLYYNLDFFAGLDLVVSTERTCLWVKRRLGARAPRFVFVPHGAGDRGVTYHPALAQFDLMLVSGRKVADEMVRHGLIRREQTRVIGYPKFDTIDLTQRKRFFANDNPVFLYNPHFDPFLSSWYDMGEAVLDHFLGAGDCYNLIVAPHVMLFRKKLHISLEYRRARIRPDVAERHRHAPNILIDVDGPNLFDMSYTLAADAYIGDVSSQVYEFLTHRGACFFLDTAGGEQYEFWRNGEVLRDPAALAARIPDWRENAAAHRAEQDRLFAYTMDYRPDEPASVRGAKALVEYLQQ